MQLQISGTLLGRHAHSVPPHRLAAMPPTGNACRIFAFGLQPPVNLRRSANALPSRKHKHTDAGRSIACIARPTRVLIVGGTGRVGAATALALAENPCDALSLTLAGRRVVRGERLAAQVRARGASHISDVRFERLDLQDEERLLELVEVHDLVLHVAGPFQKRPRPNEVLRATIAARGPDYIDVCDDVAHMHDARALRTEAEAAGVRALVCTGIYPGVSNLAAADAVARLHAPAASVRLFYYTAGSGGIGVSVLASTFLILAEQAVTYNAGKQVLRPSAAEPEVVDFGGRVGRRTVYLLNLPEVPSLHDTLMATGGGEAWAKFSTGPPFWNWLLQFMARFAPKQWMADKRAMQRFALISLPAVRFVDFFSGARTCFLVKVAAKPVEGKAPPRAVSVVYEHKSLKKSVGEATAAFVAELVHDRGRHVREIPAGVHYPEELPDGVRARICTDAVRRADRYVVQ